MRIKVIKINLFRPENKKVYRLQYHEKIKIKEPIPYIYLSILSPLSLYINTNEKCMLIRNGFIFLDINEKNMKFSFLNIVDCMYNQSKINIKTGNINC